MKKFPKKVSCLAVALCMVFLGASFVSAQNVHSWSVTIPVNNSISKQLSFSNTYQRAGNYRTNSNAAVMTMTITKGSSTVTTATLPTSLRSWVWTSWGNKGAGTYKFKYQTVGSYDFTGSIQATDSEFQG